MVQNDLELNRIYRNTKSCSVIESAVENDNTAPLNYSLDS